MRLRGPSAGVTTWGMVSSVLLPHYGRTALHVRTVEAVCGTNAGPDIAFAPLHQLHGDMRISDGQSHADHVKFAFRHRMPCGRDICDPGGMKDRDLVLHRTSPAKSRWGCWRTLHRITFDKAIAVDMAANHIEKVDLASADQSAADSIPHPLKSPCPTARPHKPQADNEIGTNPVADTVQNPAGEAQSVIQLPLCSSSRNSLRETRNCPAGDHRLRVRCHRVQRPASVRRWRNPLRYDRIPVFGFLREGPMGRLAYWRRGENWQPVSLVPVGPATEMGYLDHHGSTIFMAVVYKTFQVWNDLVAIGMEVAEGGRAVFGDDC